MIRVIGASQDVSVERGYFALRLALNCGLAQDKISLCEILEAGELRAVRAVLSGVEGNLQPKRPSLRDSIVSFDSRACEPKTKSNAVRSKPARQGAAQLSTRSLCLDCVRSIGDRDRPKTP